MRAKTIRILVFCIVLTIIFFQIQSFFLVGQDRAFQNERGFYAEKKRTLDAVFIGASNVHAFWQAPLAWKEYGISVWSFSIDSMPITAVKNMIIEARKTQPNALYIININSFKDVSADDIEIHRTTNYLNPSCNKLDLINRLSAEANIPFIERLQFVFPIIRFHSRWSELSTWDFTHKLNGYKSGIVYNAFIKNVEDISNNYCITDKVGSLSKQQSLCLNDILEYVRENNVNVLFITVPQAITEERLKQINAVKCEIQKHGYPVLDTLELITEINIHTDNDFYNKNHTNVHGSIKFTDFLAKYLVEHYDFIDKRGLLGWESWDESVALYEKYISPWSLPFEREHAPRNYELTAPKLSIPSASGQTMNLRWEASDGAESYVLFRKASVGNKNWTEISEVDAMILEYTDERLKKDVTYTYTVVPVHYHGKTRIYGRFNYLGVSGKAEE